VVISGAFFYRGLRNSWWWLGSRSKWPRLWLALTPLDDHGGSARLCFCDLGGSYDKQDCWRVKFDACDDPKSWKWLCNADLLKLELVRGEAVVCGIFVFDSFLFCVLRCVLLEVGNKRHRQLKTKLRASV